MRRSKHQTSKEFGDFLKETLGETSNIEWLEDFIQGLTERYELDEILGIPLTEAIEVKARAEDRYGKKEDKRQRRKP